MSRRFINVTALGLLCVWALLSGCTPEAWARAGKLAPPILDGVDVATGCTRSLLDGNAPTPLDYVALGTCFIAGVAGGSMLESAAVTNTHAQEVGAAVYRTAQLHAAYEADPTPENARKVTESEQECEALAKQATE